jgi:HAD superfamily hydrolase (TIGR01490 family)
MDLMGLSKNKAAVFIDLDGTLCEIYLWQGLFAHHFRNRFNRVALYFFIAIHFPIWLLYEVKLLSRDFFYKMHAKNLAWLVRGVTVERADRIWDWVIEHEIAPHLRPEMLEAIKKHQSRDQKIFLISGSFEPVLDKLVTFLGLDGAIATPLEVKNGKYIGRIIPPLNMGDGKAERLHRFLQVLEQEIDLSKSYFYNDSIVDAPVMELFGHPVAVYPDRQLASLANEQGWSIIGEVVR